MNNLPPKWAVLNDGSQLFKDTVVRFLNDSFEYTDYDGSSVGAYYGCEGDYLLLSEENEEDLIEDGIEILSIEDFISLSKEPDPAPQKPGGLAKFIDRIESKDK